MVTIYSEAIHREGTLALEFGGSGLGRSNDAVGKCGEKFVQRGIATERQHKVWMQLPEVFCHREGSCTL